MTQSTTNCPQYARDFLKALPKTDLHVHFDGSLRLTSLIQFCKKLHISLPSYTPEGLKECVFKDHYQNLGEYLDGFKYTCSALRDPEHIEQAAYELALDSLSEGVCYIEPRFAPQLLMDGTDALSLEAIMVALHKGLEKAQKEHEQRILKQDSSLSHNLPFRFGIIACLMRKFGPKGYSPFYTNFYKFHSYSQEMEVIKAAGLELLRGLLDLRDRKGLPIVGLDLAGQEEGYPAKHFREIYSLAHRHFLRKTVHAGEAYGAESIYSALTDCYADRIGHGYYLFDTKKILDPLIVDKNDYVQKLIQYIAEKRITLEVCLTSNLQTNPDIQSLAQHKLGEMLQNRLSVSLCTDNRLISKTTVTDEYAKALAAFPLPLARLKDLVAYGFKNNFYPETYLAKRAYAKAAMKSFDQISSRFGYHP
jgi:adenosine deaminase